MTDMSTPVRNAAVAHRNAVQTGCGFSRRGFLKGLGVAGVALLLPQGTRRAGAATGEKVRIGLRKATFSSWPVEFAAAGGLFQEVGLQVELEIGRAHV